MIFVSVIWSACDTSEPERPQEMYGEWSAVWSTLPAAYEGVSGITSFEMDGAFIFTADSVTVIANGFNGCVFGVDTLSHTQLWSVRNDSLFLISAPDGNGITYVMKERSENSIKMQLLDDIFLDLKKKGVPFFWIFTLNLLPWAFAVTVLLVVLFLFDRKKKTNQEKL